jgi:hypothetical protein
MGGLEAALAIAGLVLPPLVDFIKKKWIPAENDTPERTAGALATTNPDVLPAFVESTAKLYEAKTSFFNRDIIGAPSQWVVDLRGAIRPISVVGALFLFALEMMTPEFKLDESVRGAMILNVASWFGSRL